ncbi:MAG: hypothetical protein GF311_10325 [Candidatus Lokiarchaeota archaeon]|nr:hypothetical protein [Candidatus Lokiarchaeota archaeon]
MIFEDSIIKLITKVPEFGYSILKFERQPRKISNADSKFLYQLNITNHKKRLEVYYKSKKVYSLCFNPEIVQLELIDNEKNHILQRFIYMCITKRDRFKLKIVQYANINRLEFYLDSGELLEIILIPEIKIQKSLINYPFGIEETKRSKIQTLDFIWLKNEHMGILYINKNSQRFIINKENHIIKNILPKRNRYEFAIVITNDLQNRKNPLYYVKAYNTKLMGIFTEFNSSILSKSFLSLDYKVHIDVVNLWKRNNKTYIRLFNPNNKEEQVVLKGILINNPLYEVDFNYNIISKLNSNKFSMNPWEIKTLQF